ncbi:MAG: hypothetical protein OHK0038_06710 [Flammeovirgaceae bacterium]
MLPIYEAIGFKEKITKGGTTYPWIVNVLEGDMPKPYIVKLFTDRQIEQQQSVAKEVFGSVLAQQFDLCVPKPALINFSDNFYQTLDNELKKELESKNKGIKFGCAYYEDMAVIEVSKVKSILKDYEVGNIFGFDNLVRNIDRGGFRNKPNLLINDEGFLLIDHELILPFANASGNPSILNEIGGKNWGYQYEKHLLYPYLKRLKRDKKLHIFDTFAEYLKTFNPDSLDVYAIQLDQNFSMPIGDFDLLKSYLYKVKQNSSWFIENLKRLIK